MLKLLIAVPGCYLKTRRRKQGDVAILDKVNMPERELFILVCKFVFWHTAC